MGGASGKLRKTNPSAEKSKTPQSIQLNHGRLVWNNFLAPSIRRRRWYSRGNYFLSEPHLNIRTNSGYFQHPNINYNSSVATTVWKTTYICHQLLKSIARKMLSA